MNGKQAKQLRKLAKEMITSDAKPEIRFFVEKQEDGSVTQSIVPQPMSWDKGTFRRVYQDLK